MLLNALHGLTTMPGMIMALNAAIAGGLTAAMTVAATGDARLSLVLGLVTGLGSVIAFTALVIRAFARQSREFRARFPSPDDAAAS